MADGVQISSALIYQLVEDDLKSKKKPKKTKPKIPKQPQLSNNAAKKQISKEPEIYKGTPSPGWPVQTPFFLPTTPPSTNPELEKIRSALKESEKVLEKLQTHEENMVKKVTQRAKELHEKEFKLPQQKTVVCLPEKDACTLCYKDHMDDPLKCASLVSHYRDCVRGARKEAQSEGK